MPYPVVSANTVVVWGRWYDHLTRAGRSSATVSATPKLAQGQVGGGNLPNLVDRVDQAEIKTAAWKTKPLATGLWALPLLSNNDAQLGAFGGWELAPGDEAPFLIEVLENALTMQVDQEMVDALSKACTETGAPPHGIVPGQFVQAVWVRDAAVLPTPAVAPPAGVLTSAQVVDLIAGVRQLPPGGDPGQHPTPKVGGGYEWKTPTTFSGDAADIKKGVFDEARIPDTVTRDAELADAVAVASAGRTRRIVFSPGESHLQRRWVRLLTVDGVHENAGAHAKFMLAGTGDYGGTSRGTLLVHINQRGVDNIKVRGWGWDVDVSLDPIELYTRRMSSFVFELWALVADYNQAHWVHVLHEAGQIAWQCDSVATSQPSGTWAGPHNLTDIDTSLTAPLADNRIPSTIARAADATGGFAPIAELLHKLRTNQPVKALIVASSTIAGYLHPDGATGDDVLYQAAVSGAGRQCLSQLAAKYGNTNLTVVNRGIAGASSSDWLNGGLTSRVRQAGYAARSDAPDVVLLSLNTNDVVAPWNRTAASFETMMRALIMEIRRWCATVLLIPSFTHITSGAEYAGYPAACYRAAAAAGAYVVPIESVLVGTNDTLFDGAHPNVAGAARIGAAFAAHFPAPTARIPTVAAARRPRGDWADPMTSAGYFEWVTAAGGTRRHRSRPLGDLDGWPAATPPKYSGTTLMLRDSVFLTDCVQDTTDPSALRDLSGHGIDGWLGVTKGTGNLPTWAAEGLAFSGTQLARIPLDPLGRRDIVSGRHPITVHAVFKATGSNSYTVIGRRGDAPAAPFGLYSLDPGSILVFNRNNPGAQVAPPSSLTAAYLDVIFTGWAYPDGGPITGKLYLNGTLVSAAVDQVTTDCAGRDFDWTIGGRWSGSAQVSASALPQFAGTLAWLDIARSYIQDSAEAAALYAATKAKLNAERSLGLP